MVWTLDWLDPLPLWRPAEAPARAVVAATTRRGGTSRSPFDSLNLGLSTDDDHAAVSENRRRVLERLGLEPALLATAGQIHGTAVARVTAPGLHPSVDALVTRTAGLALAIAVADCLSLLYVAPAAVAAAHSGWRGTVAGMPGAALDAVCALSDAAPIDVRVFIGHGIGPCCYRVGEDVAVQFPSDAVIRDASGVRLDLVAAARRQLLEAGVAPSRIAGPPVCTSCASEWCFSHRRDAGRSGRHWGLVALRP
jgi:hypothetical protein